MASRGRMMLLWVDNAHRQGEGHPLRALLLEDPTGDLLDHIQSHLVDTTSKQQVEERLPLEAYRIGQKGNFPSRLVAWATRPTAGKVEEARVLLL